MAIERQISSTRIEVTLSGKLTPEDLFGAFEGALDDPAAPPNAQLLIDVTASETLPPNQALREIARIIADRCDVLGGRVAVLVAHQVRFGLARQLGTWLEHSGMDVRPFHDRSKALGWLDASVSNRKD